MTHKNPERVRTLILIPILLFLTEICYSQVVINEVQSSNSSTIVDNYGEYEDWIEIYNPNTFKVNIGGLVLKDNVDTWQIPIGDTSTILSPNGFFLLWADDEEYQGKFHTNFKLSATNGELLGLYESDSVTQIDSVNIPPLLENQSYGRCNDRNRTIFNTPTPLIINECLSTSTLSIKNNGLIVYPTISTGEININLQKSVKGEINMYLYSVNGKLILYKKHFDKKFTTDLSHLPNNTYILKIFTEKDFYINKIVLNNQ